MAENQTTDTVRLKVADARPEIISAPGGEDLKLILGEFTGPFDLLLFLIKQEKVDIYDIPIARITDAYLHYIRLMRDLDINLAGDFLVLAATLIEIKSKTLLPRAFFPEDAEEAADPREELVRQLLEHQKYQSAAQMLWSKATVEQAVFPRGPLETDNQNPEISVTVFDLFNVFQKIMARRQADVELEIQREELSLGQMLQRLRALLQRQGALNLQQFLTELKSRREIVVVFLALLEMVKASEITLTQELTFGDIIARAV